MSEQSAIFEDVSAITDSLYISAWPKGEHTDQIREMGIRLILSMHWQRPARSLGETPVDLVWLPSIDSPFTPIPMSHLFRGVRTALPVIQQGGKVLAHCKYGIHRSVVMACCVLIGQGYSSEAAMRLVKEKRAQADPYAGYIQARIRKFEKEWSTSGVAAPTAHPQQSTEE